MIDFTRPVVTQDTVRDAIDAAFRALDIPLDGQHCHRLVLDLRGDSEVWHTDTANSLDSVVTHVYLENEEVDEPIRDDQTIAEYLDSLPWHYDYDFGDEF
jgi:hypothetical protein